MLQGLARSLSKSRFIVKRVSPEPSQSSLKKSKTTPTCNCHIEIAKLKKNNSSLQKQLLDTQATLRNIVKEGKKFFDDGAQVVFDHWRQSLSKEVGVELRLAGLTDVQLNLVRQSTTMYYDNTTESPRWRRRKIAEWNGN